MKMKKSISQFFAYFIIVGIILGTGCITEEEEKEQEKNLILNGGFEEGSDDTPDY